MIQVNRRSSCRYQLVPVDRYEQLLIPQDWTAERSLSLRMRGNTLDFEQGPNIPPQKAFGPDVAGANGGARSEIGTGDCTRHIAQAHGNETFKDFRR